MRAQQFINKASKQRLDPKYVAEGDLDRFKKYIRPVVKTTPKIEKKSNPSGRSGDHNEWVVTTPTGEIHRYNSKKQAQEHYDSFGQQGVAEGLEQSLAAMVGQDQSERNEYSQFVKSQAGGDWSKGAKMYAQLKKRPIDDIFGDAIRLNQFMKMKFDFDKFTNADWDDYWLLAQHCDNNRDFQKNALSIIKKYQGTDHSHYKYLYDRISMGLTGKQKYGTQNVKEQGMAEGGVEDRQWSNKNMEKLRRAETELDDMFGKPDDAWTKTKQSQIKNRIKTKPMAGPKGQLPEQGMAEARGMASVNPYVELMQSLGWFMSMNTATIQQDAVDSMAQQELKSMQQQFRKPVINGKSFSDVIGDPTMFKHPKVAPVLLKFAYDILGYIEPRIKKYIRPELQSKWIGSLAKLKDQYRAAIQFTSGQQGVSEGRGSAYKEIEFVCVNPEFPDGTDPKLQKQMYAGLRQITGVIPLFQDHSDYSEGQYSLTAIYKDLAVRGQILKLAKQLGVRVDLEQPVTDDYVDRAIRGEHEGQQGVAEGWKSTLAGAALSGAMALGAGGAHARVEPGSDPGINRLTGKPIATQQVATPDKQTVAAPKGYSTEYLQKAANPNRTGVFMISIEKAQELLDQLKETRFPKKKGVAESLTLDEQFDIIEEMVEQVAAEHGVDPDVIWEDFEAVNDHELFESAAWRRKEGKNKKGGLNAKGVASYRRENPGSKLQTAVTTKPSKLKPGSKAAKRRKSFCARMGGMKGAMKKDGKPTRKALALRKWNC